MLKMHIIYYTIKHIIIVYHFYKKFKKSCIVSFHRILYLFSRCVAFYRLNTKDIQYKSFQNLLDKYDVATEMNTSTLVNCDSSSKSLAWDNLASLAALVVRRTRLPSPGWIHVSLLSPPPMMFAPSFSFILARSFDSLSSFRLRSIDSY